jgi:acid phosphatase family membrane protein YuiD
MQFWEKINNNGYEVLFALAVANVSAQILKVLISSLKHNKTQYKLAVSTGGMPSSHSATVIAMATSIGLIEGFNSTLFALSLCVSFIVMYDAAGIRRSASRQAIVINQIIKVITKDIPSLSTKRLKELLGHSPTEVIAGAAWGILVSFSVRALIKYITQ